MRIQRPKAGVDEGDMTPMIDIVFQLIAFFMVLVNLAHGTRRAPEVNPERVTRAQNQYRQC